MKSRRPSMLAMFLPLIISSGGNSGSQASTSIIRAMALGEVTLRDWWRVASRELQSGLSFGLILGVIGVLRVAVWSILGEQYFHRELYGPHWPLVALTVGAALVGVVLWGSLAGSMLPFVLRRLGADPATSSAPVRRHPGRRDRAGHLFQHRAPYHAGRDVVAIVFAKPIVVRPSPRSRPTRCGCGSRPPPAPPAYSARHLRNPDAD